MNAMPHLKPTETKLKEVPRDWLMPERGDTRNLVRCLRMVNNAIEDGNPLVAQAMLREILRAMEE